MKKTVAPFGEGDVANELLRQFRIGSSVLCRSVMAAPWGFGVASRDVGSFHMVLAGRGWLEVDTSDELVPIGTGDLALLPTGSAHWVKDSPSTTAPALTTILAHHQVVDGELRFGADEGPLTEIVCGVFSLEEPRLAPWTRRLPALILLRAESDGSGWRWAAAQALRDEASVPTKGGAAIVNRLLESLLADAIRSELATHDSETTGPAMMDERIGRVLAQLHDHLAEPWNVDAMANVAAMSRSAFAERFRSLVGEAPIQHLIGLRLARAAILLRSTDATVAEVARAVGYGAEEALSRAFKARFGTSPRAFRNHQGNDPR
jgi:AraC-like DNA-binding protein/mannose-6-phosphate isomerase-like protein (cupin superfamily)